MKGYNLVSEFIRQTTDDGRYPKTDALKILNAVLRRRDDQQRLWNWEKGYRPVPRDVHEFMLHYVLMGAIQAEGGRPPGKQGRLNLAARLTPPPRRKPNRPPPGPQPE